MKLLEEEMEKTYAGIGSRNLTDAEKEFCIEVSSWLNGLGWGLRTGACKGADQAFASGTLDKCTLCLPWWGYEKEWVLWAEGRGAKSVILAQTDERAWDSVDEFHPNPSSLSRGALALHARNYLVVSRCRFVLAWPKVKNGHLGGTGQGIRIAESMGIPVFRLDLEEVRHHVVMKMLG